jgi:hypothetical protein
MTGTLASPGRAPPQTCKCPIGELFMLVPSISRWQWHPITVAGTQADSEGALSWRMPSKSWSQGDVSHFCVWLGLTCQSCQHSRRPPPPQARAPSSPSASSATASGPRWAQQCTITSQTFPTSAGLQSRMAVPCLPPVQELLEKLQRPEPLEMRVSGEPAAAACGLPRVLPPGDWHLAPP